MSTPTSLSGSAAARRAEDRGATTRIKGSRAEGLTLDLGLSVRASLVVEATRTRPRYRQDEGGLRDKEGTGKGRQGRRRMSERGRARGSSKQVLPSATPVKQGEEGRNIREVLVPIVRLVAPAGPAMIDIALRRNGMSAVMSAEADGRGRDGRLLESRKSGGPDEDPRDRQKHDGWREKVRRRGEGRGARATESERRMVVRRSANEPTPSL